MGGKAGTLEERLWRSVNKNGPVPEHARELGPCWLWTRYRNSAGYGWINAGDGKSTSVHLVAWKLERGAIPDGLHLDHLCRVRHCVNPSHLEPVTPAENTRRTMSPTMVSHREGRCARGHELAVEGSRKANGGVAYCKACRREDRATLNGTITEKAFMQQVRDLASLMGWNSYHTYSSIRSDPGFPDLVFVRERVVFAELKAQRGRLSPEQSAWLDWLKSAGGEVYCWRPADWDDVTRILGPVCATTHPAGVCPAEL